MYRTVKRRIIQLIIEDKSDEVINKIINSLDLTIKYRKDIPPYTRNELDQLLKILSENYKRISTLVNWEIESKNK